MTNDTFNERYNQYRKRRQKLLAELRMYDELPDGIIFGVIQTPEDTDLEPAAFTDQTQ